eukprot:12938304-Prorocentrum_lima.AAC.1
MGSVADLVLLGASHVFGCHGCASSLLCVWLHFVFVLGLGTMFLLIVRVVGRGVGCPVLPFFSPLLTLDGGGVVWPVVWPARPWSLVHVHVLRIWGLGTIGIVQRLGCSAVDCQGLSALRFGLEDGYHDM